MSNKTPPTTELQIPATITMLIISFCLFVGPYLLFNVVDVGDGANQ